jgi:hypothetical protein
MGIRKTWREGVAVSHKQVRIWFLCQNITVVILCNTQRLLASFKHPLPVFVLDLLHRCFVMMHCICLCRAVGHQHLPRNKLTADFQMWHYSNSNSMPLQAGAEDIAAGNCFTSGNVLKRALYVHFFAKWVELHESCNFCILWFRNWQRDLLSPLAWMR